MHLIKNLFLLRVNFLTCDFTVVNLFLAFSQYSFRAAIFLIFCGNPYFFKLCLATVWSNYLICFSEKEVTDFRLAQLKFKQSIDIEKTTFLASHENATYLPNTTNTEIESLSENSNFLKESCLYFEEKTNFILYLHVWSNFVGLFLLPTAVRNSDPNLCFNFTALLSLTSSTNFEGAKKNKYKQVLN